MKFILRQWNLKDIESLVKYANNSKIAANLTDQFPHPYTKEHGEAFIKMATKNSPDRIFAIEINGEASGGIGLHFQTDIHKKNAELGYWLAEPYWGKGIMTKVVLQMIDYGFKTFEIDRIFARPFGTNIGSQKVLEKAGFILEGKFEKTLFKQGEYLDELIYAIRKK
ncbi:MAG: GNAT family N-acetyltransferase [Lutibacter sp.]|uniref:GNAT family N-acetyltransferase n=1 Tax=Lutibacter sp. TaxID=1925666 RepID=UPI0017ECF54C|nr:GNAT family protein [Lutibacter sp.]MBT8317574.1 GNAT family N-acetyltransferase [Lutibacter sp.]NNJ58433.1 GNAT family N-acetyltransferase [Lutibacter sp.]